MSTTFVQYKYCSLCRASCKKWRKHVHSPKHQEIVKNIQTKFLKKISDAKCHIEQPHIKDANWNEAERKVWCYSCTCDVDLHLRKTTVVGECIVVGAGFLGHITRKDHGENTAKFLKDNLVDMKRTSEFLLDNDVFLRFLEIAEKASVDFLNEKKNELRKAAYAMRLKDALHRHVMNQGLLEQKRQQLSKCADSSQTHEDKCCHNHLKNSKETPEEGERKKTAEAFGEGLTLVERSSEDDSQGNIYSNAIPPWLKKDETERTNKDGFIGPSINDWNKHKKLEQKRKLPACRVGAKFDRKSVQGDDWLPSFGGVWSHGPRTKSSAHFRRRFDSAHQKRNERNETQSIHTLDTTESIPSTPSFSSSYVNTISDNNLHHNAVSNDALSRLQYPVENKQPPPNREMYSPISNTHFHSTLFAGPSHSNDYFSSSSPISAKTVKPYISKRRKLGESSTSSSSSITSSVFQGSFYPEERFSSPISNVTGGQWDKNIFGIQNNNASSSTSSLRLLHTPVLAKKK